MNRERLEGHLGQGLSIAKIAEIEERHPSTIGYWLKVHGLTANGAKHGRRAEVEVEVLRALADQGRTIREIASTLEVSTSTVNRLLRRHGIERRSASRRAAALEARARGETRFLSLCRKHGEAEFLAFPNGRSRCAACNSEAVARFRRRIKETLVAEAGGICVACGFEGHPSALQFHHLDPSTKLHGVAQAGATRSLERARSEAAKCVLLCANCHSALEAGALSLPVKLSGSAA